MSGFTLIEMLIVIGLTMLIGATGVVVGIDSYQRYLFRTDAEKAASILQKARGSAINNIGESSHGVYFASPAAFILFRGTSYAARNPAFDLALEKSKGGTVSGLSEVVFTPLSGETIGGNLVLGDGVRSVTLTTNYEGGINW